MSQQSKVLKFERYRWSPVELREYREGGDRFRFQATGEEPLGFLCVVDRNRDRPVAIAPEEAGVEPVGRP